MCDAQSVEAFILNDLRFLFKWRHRPYARQLVQQLSEYIFFVPQHEYFCDT